MRHGLTIILLAACVPFIAAWSQNPIPRPSKVGKPQQKQSSPSEEAPNADQRGTEQSPLVVKTLIPAKTKAETDQEAGDREQKSSNDRHIVELTGALVFIAFLQFLVYAYQAKKLRETVESASEQSEAMERHIGEAERSANAMENIADKIDFGNKAIMRAYVSVIVGAAVYQARQDGLKFEGKPTLVNTGSTPARNLRLWIAADIVSRDKAETFDYPIAEETARAPSVAAPHQQYILSAVVKDFVPDAEVHAIKEGVGKTLTVWGVVTYDDIFGDHHTTKFAQWLSWLPNNNVFGHFVPGQNDMD